MPMQDPDAQKLYTENTPLWERITLGTIPYAALLNNYGLNEVLQAARIAGWNSSQLTSFANQWHHLHDQKDPGFVPPGGKTPGGGSTGSGGGGGGSSSASLIQSYIDIAKDFGENISAAVANKLLAGRVSISEWTDRLRGDETLKSNEDLFAAYNETLKANGKKPLDENDLVTFMAGKSTKENYDLFNEAYLRFATDQAGQPDPKKLSYTQLAGKVKTGISVPSLEKGYGQMIQDLKLLPYSRLHKIGLSRSELIQLEFGGPLQAKAKEKVQRIVAEQKLLAQGPVEAQSVPTGQGVRTIGLEGISGPER